MKKKVREILEGVVIESVAAEGRSIARVNGKVLFVPFAIPGDIADIVSHSETTTEPLNNVIVRFFRRI